MSPPSTQIATRTLAFSGSATGAAMIMVSAPASICLICATLRSRDLSFPVRVSGASTKVSLGTMMVAMGSDPSREIFPVL